MERQEKTGFKNEIDICRGRLVDSLLNNRAFLEVANRNWIADETGSYRIMEAKFEMGEHEYIVNYSMGDNSLAVVRREKGETEIGSFEGVKFFADAIGESRVFFWSKYFGQMKGSTALGMAEIFVDSLGREEKMGVGVVE